MPILYLRTAQTLRNSHSPDKAYTYRYVSLWLSGLYTRQPNALLRGRNFVFKHFFFKMALLILEVWWDCTCVMLPLMGLLYQVRLRDEWTCGTCGVAVDRVLMKCLEINLSRCHFSNRNSKWAAVGQTRVLECFRVLIHSVIYLNTKW